MQYFSDLKAIMKGKSVFKISKVQKCETAKASLRHVVCKAEAYWITRNNDFKDTNIIKPYQNNRLHINERLSKKKC